MYVKAEKTINIPYGYFCKNCSQLKFGKYANGKPYCYCDITGEILDNGKGGAIKTDKCFAEIRKALKEE